MKVTSRQPYYLLPFTFLLLLLLSPLLLMARPGVAARSRHQDDLYHRGNTPVQSPLHPYDTPQHQYDTPQHTYDTPQHTYDTSPRHQPPPQPYQAAPQPYQAAPQPYQAPPQPYQAPPQPYNPPPHSFDSPPHSHAFNPAPQPPPPPHSRHDTRAFLARVTQSGQVDVTNASSFNYDLGRGSYLLGLPPQDFKDIRFKQQPHRTWTARPRPDYDDDVTTRDPAIPENPEGLKDPSLLVGPWEEQPTIRDSKAIFKGVNGSLVGAQAGTVANLPCIIQNRADHETVSWIRLRDHHLITVGRQTYSQDDRFSVTYNRHLNQWTLHLRYVQARDAGEYVCQLSTHPPMTFISTLTITQASAEIAGGPERYVQEGSSVLLNCSLRQHTQAPEYVFWYHNRTMINFDTNRQVSVRKTNDGSILTLAAVGKRDSGNYTCHPANARHASITLHIIAGDAPAAMQVSGGRRPHLHTPALLLLQLLLLLPLLHLTTPTPATRLT